MKYQKPIALTLYGVTLGYFLGKTIYALMPVLPWPYDAVVSYILGILACLFISFKLLGPWQTSRSTKAITAIILLGFVAAIGIELEGLNLQVSRLTLIVDALQRR